MKFKKLLVITSVLALLGNGCVKTPKETTSVTDPYGKAETALEDREVTSSGILDPNQKNYSLADRISWYEKLQWSKTCEEDFALASSNGDLADPVGLAFYKINETKYLLRADCYLAAYQKGMIFMLVTVDGQNISSKQLEQQIYNPVTKKVEVDAGSEGQFLGFDTFDVNTKLLTIATKDRGVGDCGSRGTYRVNNTDLELIKEVYMSCEEADKFHLKNPEAEKMPEWPIIYEKKSVSPKPQSDLLDDSNWDLPDANANLNPKQTTYSMSDRLGWYHKLGWSKTCEQEYRDFSQSEDGGLRFYEIENNKYILSITCDVYAYQANLLFMLITFDPQTKTATGAVQTLHSYNPISKKLEPIIDEDNKTPTVLGFDNYNKTEKTLGIFTKLRGVGDCGSRGTYKVIANKITLIKYEAQSCEEADAYALADPDGDINDWPVLYFLR